MGKRFIKIQDWTLNFLEIYEVKGNKIVLENGREILLNKEEKRLLTQTSNLMGLPNLFVE